jgi:hypothetical protein
MPALHAAAMGALQALAKPERLTNTFQHMGTLRQTVE